MFGREQCCPDDYGGSHYHCVKCGCVSSMLGHHKGECPPENERPEYAKRFVYEPEDKGN